MSAGLYAALAVGVGLGAYALYRASESDGKVKTKITTTGAGTWVDYKNPADATSDKRPEAAYLVKPYQILNAGGGTRPMEVDAQGQPTGRMLQLPGEPAGKNSILVGAERAYHYQNDRDAHVDTRPEAQYLVKPYEIFNPGGGIRPYEVDAQGGPTGRQLVLPGESPTVANAAQYVMVGQSMARREWGGDSAQSDYFTGIGAYGGWKYGGGNMSANLLGSGMGGMGGGGMGGGWQALAMKKRMWRLRQQMMMQQQLAQQQQMMQQQLADQQAQADLLAQQAQAGTADDGTAGLDDAAGGV